MGSTHFIKNSSLLCLATQHLSSGRSLPIMTMRGSAVMESKPLSNKAVFCLHLLGIADGTCYSAAQRYRSSTLPRFRLWLPWHSSRWPARSYCRYHGSMYTGRRITLTCKFSRSPTLIWAFVSQVTVRSNLRPDASLFCNFLCSSASYQHVTLQIKVIVAWQLNSILVRSIHGMLEHK